MEPLQLVLIFLALGIVAFLYSSVGHAGASGYIAVMALFGFTTDVIKPTALTLNILVATIGAVQFWRAGHFRWSLFWPFALLSIPAAYFGGATHLPSHLFRPLLGAVLLFSAARLFFRVADSTQTKAPDRPTALATGASIGFLSGLTGTGGGIFLTPLMVFCKWAPIKNVAATSVVFILVNSVAGLLGYVDSGKPLATFAWFFATAALLGGTLGSYFGSRRFPPKKIQTLLAFVLIIAGCKLLFT